MWPLFCFTKLKTQIKQADAAISAARRNRQSEISLANFRLTSLPPDLRFLSNITTLDLTGNPELTEQEISDSLPPSIETLHLDKILEHSVCIDALVFHIPRLRNVLFSPLAMSPQSSAPVVIGLPSKEEKPATVPQFDLSDVAFDANALLGQGAFSTVHLCQYRGASLVLKMTPRLRQIGDKQRDEFLNEMKILNVVNSQSNNPHVVRLVAVSMESLAMLFTPLAPHGLTLHNLIHNQPASADQSTILRLLGNCASGLDAIHAVNVCHLDFKPLNVLITGQGDFLTACICDFGIARFGQGVSPTIAGTPAYMPPEASTGVFGLANDIYAFGVSLWECMCGEFVSVGVCLNEFKIGNMSLRRIFKQCTEQQPGDRICVSVLLNNLVNITRTN